MTQECLKNAAAGALTIRCVPFSAPLVIWAGGAIFFVQLALIRYLPGQIRILGYFTNFILLAAFLGCGSGILSARRWSHHRWLPWLAPVTLAAIVGLTQLGRLFNVMPATDQFLFLEYSTSRVLLPLYFFLSVSFVLLALSFLPLGYLVGQSLQGPQPLRRYVLNILGSLLGIFLFILIGISAAPPWCWMLVAALLAASPLIKAPLRWQLLALGSVVLTTGVAWYATHDSLWSPYHKISTGALYYSNSKGIIPEWRLLNLSAQERHNLHVLPRSYGFVLRVNDDFYQTPLNLSNSAVARYPGLAALRIQYDLPFRIRLKGLPKKLIHNGDPQSRWPAAAAHPKIGDVLVLGAGTGNDVAAALRNGARHVDAVEIDPVILQLGQQYHPEKPYQDTRVTVHLDDARSFLVNSAQRYDMIVYGLLDSHILLSHRSNIRLDSFVFTRESFTLARSRLKPGGLLVVSHAVGCRFFYERMCATLAAAFGKPPLVISDYLYHPVGIIYLSGDQLPAGQPVLTPENVLEDDWPFLYLKKRAIPPEYLAAMGLMALIALTLVRSCTSREQRGLDWYCLALGCGFLLLETRAIAVLAVLIGATWQVNALIFIGVLLMNLLAAIWAANHPTRSFPWGYYVLLALFLILNFVLPLRIVLGFPLILRLTLGILLLCLPLFASGVLFALRLERTGQAGRALASNLIGALLGGLIEYTSMMLGLRYLLVLAAFFYCMAALWGRYATRPVRCSQT